MNLVGREGEKEILQKCLSDNTSHFVALYGRRRVGKTYLIRQFFDNQFDFYVTGLSNGTKADQIAHFHYELTKDDQERSIPPKTWMDAFRLLTKRLDPIEDRKIIVFIDELPWMDTPRSKFIVALEWFWNSWASARENVLLVVCGSAASWMLNNLIHNKGGLHNRVTRSIKLKPFNLNETEKLLKNASYHIDRYQIVQLYMVFGGIPYYLEKIDPQLSVAQNINQLCFENPAPFKNEYSILFKSLFHKAEHHEAIIKALSSKRIGLTRKELLKKVDLKDGGSFSRILDELEASDFIRRYNTFGKKSRDSLYQVIDPFVFFHFNHILKNSSDNYWLRHINSPKINSWQGLAYELICLLHVKQIKQALGISGIFSDESAWHNNDAQIDLLIDREDRIINLIEVKFSIDEYEIDKTQNAKIRNKIASFMKQTETKKTLWMVLITTFGLKSNKYSGEIQAVLSLDHLFKILEPIPR